MAKQCKDFTFNGKKLSSFGNFVTVDFDGGDSEVMLGMSREMEMGSTNTYRVEANYYGDKWSDVLQFEIHIIKSPCLYSDQTEMRFSKEEIRQITRWLTSPHYPQWIKFEYKVDDNNPVVNYKGWFSNIETWVVGGHVYGLRLFVSCTTPFGYTDDIVHSHLDITTYKNVIVSNDSDELESYCYPQITIEPKSNTGVYICNLSDCEILKSGTLSVTNGAFNSLLDTIESYAKSEGYELIYAGVSDDNTVVALCDDTAVQFYLKDKYNNETKCSAFYLNDSKNYWIVTGGFMFLEAQRDLNIYIDCQRLLITDRIGRMVTYDELGIADVDNMYWLRLINGSNTLLLYGQANFTITHRESRKVGE